MLNGSDAWCLKVSEKGFLRRIKRFMVRAMCGIQLKHRKRPRDLILMLGFNETMD